LGQTDVFSASPSLASRTASPRVIRSSFSRACDIESQTKNPTRNSIATMGMLSGFLTMRTKLGSSSDTRRNASATPATASATRGFQKARYRRARKNTIAATVMKISGAVTKLTSCLKASTTFGGFPAS
jgi:hypothetical protein